MRSATARGSEYATRLGQPGGGQRGHSPVEGFSRHCVDVVKVNDAVSWYAISVGVQIKLGCQTATGAGKCCDDDGANSSSDRITREHENGTVAAGGYGEH